VHAHAFQGILIPGINEKCRVECKLLNIKEITKPARITLWSLGLFSAVINLLMLTGAIYMLQVYDRVVPSQSVPTLVVLTGLVAFLFLSMGLLEHVRSRALVRLGAQFRSKLELSTIKLMGDSQQNDGQGFSRVNGLREIEQVKNALGSPAMGAAFDIPWVPIYFFALFVLHEWAGWYAVVSAVLILLLAIVSHFVTKKRSVGVGQSQATADRIAASYFSGLDNIKPLGMRVRFLDRLVVIRKEAMSEAVGSADVSTGFASHAKALRQFLQSAMLGLGAYLAIHGELSGGSMIAGAILLGRALAPIDQLISQWPILQKALVSWKTLKKLFTDFTPDNEKLTLPVPKGELRLRGVVISTPQNEKPLLSNLNFIVHPGQVVVIIGASGSGKTTLAKSLVGYWPVMDGEISYAGAGMIQYEEQHLGSAIGYMPQDITLFEGSIADNIARFDQDISNDKVIAAAQAAGAHKMITGMPQGYATQISHGGSGLSGGQRQRIALARAFYGNPHYLILDEPNSNLDEQGLRALHAAVNQAREQGKVVLVFSHHPSAFSFATHVMVLGNGVIQAFDERDKIINRIKHQRMATNKTYASENIPQED